MWVGGWVGGGTFVCLALLQVQAFVVQSAVAQRGQAVAGVILQMKRGLAMQTVAGQKLHCSIGGGGVDGCLPCMRFARCGLKGLAVEQLAAKTSSLVHVTGVRVASHVEGVHLLGVGVRCVPVSSKSNRRTRTTHKITDLMRRLCCVHRHSRGWQWDRGRIGAVVHLRVNVYLAEFATILVDAAAVVICVNNHTIV